MTRNQRRAAGGLFVAAAALAVATLYVTQVQPLAVDMCVTNWEDGGQSGDQMTVCATPANLKVPNLATHTEGLHNGCNRSVNQSSNWSDCISSARVSSMPAAQKVVWYQDTNYGTQIACVDANGTTNVDLTGSANDLASSFRVLGGNC